MKPLPDHGPTHEAGASCCTTFYEQDWVRVLANDIFHPGGAALTRRTAAAMSLPPGHRLLDLGSSQFESVEERIAYLRRIAEQNRNRPITMHWQQLLSRDRLGSQQPPSASSARTVGS